jgi:predicted dehydrogenase
MKKVPTSVRLAVWGLGRHALNNILPAVAATGGLELYGLCSRNEQTVSSAAKQWNCKGWTEPGAMLDDARVDVVYVATPIALHAEHALAALTAGKHAWCEKPLTSRLQDTVDVVELSRQARLSLCEGHMYLHHPHFKQLSRYLSDQRIGNILSIGIRFGIPKLAEPGFRTERALGGGALLDVGSYPISAIHAMFPAQALTTRYATISTRGDVLVDTDGSAVLELASGGIGTLEWRTHTAYRNEVDIWGDEGSIYTDRIFSKPASYEPVFRFRNLNGVETTESSAAADHFVLMLASFKNMIGDAEAMEMERARILRRAATLEMIAATAMP